MLPTILSFSTETTATVREENIDDSDEYLNIRDTTTHVKINSKLKLNDKANKTPRYVATPLPPLNFSQIGKICPRKTIKADNCISCGKN